MNGEGWESVLGGGEDSVRRMRVPGGWLYQVALVTTIEHHEHGKAGSVIYGWQPPVFVPEVKP